MCLTYKVNMGNETRLCMASSGAMAMDASFMYFEF